MKIIGYGICGPGEADRYMKATLDEFARLCDEVVILCNNTSQAEDELVDSYGFRRVSDRREWGKWQWRIKQDFIERDIKAIAEKGDVLVCLDMDEVFDKHLTREWLRAAPLEAYHVFIVDLWNDGYKPESCFWNVRIWKWNGETKFKQKPVHCGLAPEWTYLYHRHAPFILKHYGLKDRETRLRKIERYKQYDPDAKYLDRKYYDMLSDENSKPFDEDALHDQIAKEVETYKQTKPRTMTDKKKPRYAYIKNQHGEVIDVPERHVELTLKRPGFELIGWADDADAEIEEMFEDTDLTQPQGAYQRSADDLDREAKEYGAEPTIDDEELFEEDDFDLLGKDGPSDADLKPADGGPDVPETEEMKNDKPFDAKQTIEKVKKDIDKKFVADPKVGKKKLAAKRKGKK